MEREAGHQGQQMLEDMIKMGQPKKWQREMTGCIYAHTNVDL